MASSRQIERDAAQWLARRERGDWSALEQAELDAWLEASTAHRVAFLRLDAAWAQSDRLKALGAGSASDGVPARGQWMHSSFDLQAPRAEATVEPSSTQAATGHDAAALVFAPRRSAGRGGRGLRYAAVAVLALVGVASFWGWQRHAVVEQASYRTAMGDLSDVALADGSQATLSSDSRIEVALSRSERHVELQQGEAFFDVAKDAGRPFAVVAGGRRVIAVGTRFSVRREGADLRVVVTEGTVRLESEPVGGRRQPTSVLPAGSTAFASRSGVLVRIGSVEDAERQVDWRRGYLVFRDTPLSAAAAEFNRYNARKIVIGDAAAGELRVGGNFRWSNTEVFVRLLEQVTPVRVEHHPDRIVLHSR
ncbi:FecR family protein [Lysobacter antibioticus]|uniref:FecR family protein n=1 Tax=Lysobacter antibioticus TaxID=84531 RepID=A0A0S2FH61_LYSAN|nr:FecR domain-containing protein [Lysobacter antibioticus]ALN82855.1 fecR family protein [Lysobacter antibioticus]